jgi:hypothetical protein
MGQIRSSDDAIPLMKSRRLSLPGTHATNRAVNGEPVLPQDNADPTGIC